MQIAVIQFNPTVGALLENRIKILKHIEKSEADLILFPELALCGYPPEDLVLLPDFVKAAEHELDLIAKATKKTVVLGTIREEEKLLYNCAAILKDGKIVGYQDKTLLPTYDVFYERRYFEPARSHQIWEIGGERIVITICEDIWQPHLYPIQFLKNEKPTLLLNLSASPYYRGCSEERQKVCAEFVKAFDAPLVYCNQVGGNDSLIFDGSSFVLFPDGKMESAKRFEEDEAIFDLSNPRDQHVSIEPMEDLEKALILGLRDYFYKQGFTKATFGLSGGVDSAVVAYLAQKALGKEHVLAVTMPSPYTSQETLKDATELAKRLGIPLKTLQIHKIYDSFLETLAPHFEEHKPDITEENLQARIRGTLLMAFSNKFGYLVLGPGNKSEMAMGYTTLYGDMCGGLGVLSDVTKQGVYALANWINRKEEIIPNSIITRAPTAELRPNQKDSDSLPDYEIIDAFLEAYIEECHSPEQISEALGLDLSLVKALVAKVHLNEYKRRQAPPGLRVTKKAFTAGRRFPIVQGWKYS